MDTTKIEEYQTLCEDYDIDFQLFQDSFEKQSTKDEVLQDFGFSSGLGVRGFPTVALKTNETYYLITNGYQKAEQMLEAVDQVKAASNE